MSKTIQVGDYVVSSEHPKAIGEVIRMNDKGDLTIQFTTQPNEILPFGHIITEFWPVSDLAGLVVVE